MGCRKASSITRIFLLMVLTGAFPLTSPGFSQSTVSSYAELRNLSGTSGRVVQLVAPGIGGTFSWASSPAKGWDDNAGISFPAISGGYWIRQFTYDSTDPINLDWFQVSNNTDITTVLKNIATYYTPTFSVEAPSTAMTLICDYIDFSGYSLTSFSFLESTAAVTIQQYTGTAHSGILWNIVDIPVVIGGTSLNLTFNGVASTSAPQTGSYNDAQGLLNLRPTGNASTPFDITVRANINNAYSKSIDTYPTVYPAATIDTLTLRGTFGTGRIRAQYIQNFVAENIVVSDPYGRGCAWNGNAYPNNVYTCGARNPSTCPNGYAYGMGIGINNITTSVTGTVTLQYGCAAWGEFSVTPYVGSSGSPFVVNLDSLGYSSTGVQIDMQKAVFALNGKVDATITYPYGQRYLKIQDLTPTQGYGNATYFGFNIEANRSECTPYSSNNFDITIQDLQATGDSNLFVGKQYGMPPSCTRTGNPDTATGVKVHGLGTNLGLLHVFQQDDVSGGTWNNIEFTRLTYQDSDAWAANPYDYPVSYQPCSNSSVHDLSMTGTLSSDTSCTSNTGSNINFSKASGAIVTVASGSNLTLSNICANSGTQITGSGTVTLDGISISLPYSFTNPYQRCNLSGGLTPPTGLRVLSP